MSFCDVFRINAVSRNEPVDLRCTTARTAGNMYTLHLYDIVFTDFKKMYLAKLCVEHSSVTDECNVTHVESIRPTVGCST